MFKRGRNQTSPRHIQHSTPMLRQVEAQRIEASEITDLGLNFTRYGWNMASYHEKLQVFVVSDRARDKR